MDAVIRTISWSKAGIIFLVFTGYFLVLVSFFIPFLSQQLSINPALYWFITGYLLFVPLFVCALCLIRAEGFSKKKELLKALSIKSMTNRDWKYTIGSTILAFVLTGLIMTFSLFLSETFGLKPLDTTPWFMEFKPFHGIEKLLLLVWLPMFAFNILGEEFLWRGYIQTRLERKSNYAWLFVSLFWLIFHIPFGFDLLLVLIPIVLILPYAIHKTKNTTVGIIIHALYNGPSFVLISLGFIG